MQNFKKLSMLLSTALVAALLLSSCGKKMHFATSTVVPAAEGTIKYKKDKNNNYHIDVKILHLADPKRLIPSNSTYVLWMETEQNGVKNLGQITSSSGWLSSTKKATLSAVTSFLPKSFFITAEGEGNISYPGQQVVLQTR